MTGKSGSAEQAGEGRPDREHKSSSLEAELPARAAQSGHLYLVHSAEAPQGPTIMKRPSTARTHNNQKGMLDRSVQVQIGRLLRDVFADVAEEPVPERFVRLLELLEIKEKQP
jgi:hypothetical protein